MVYDLFYVNIIFEFVRKNEYSSTIINISLKVEGLNISYPHFFEVLK